LEIERLRTRLRSVRARAAAAAAERAAAARLGFELIEENEVSREGKR
jgi:hypothetical protein